jgi:hypothetical protein
MLNSRQVHQLYLPIKIEKRKERQREPRNSVDVSCYLYIFTFM